MIFFTSDTHFGHTNVIKYSNRPFAHTHEMDETIITNWNSVVKPNDIIYHLGDFSFSSPAKTKDIVYALNGRKILIRGNHDKSLKSMVLDLFEEVHYYHELNYNDNKIVMCHYPFEVWNKKHYGSICLHGHSHGTLKNKMYRRFDVGVDTNNYFPYSIDKIFEMANNQNIDVSDGHEERR